MSNPKVEKVAEMIERWLATHHPLKEEYPYLAAAFNMLNRSDIRSLSRRIIQALEKGRKK